MDRRRLVGWIAAAVSAAAMGCNSSEPVEPLSNIGSEYVLRSVAGKVVPTPIIVGEVSQLQIVADTMRFYRDGRGTEIVVTRLVYPNDDLGEVERETREFTYHIVRGTVEIQFPCPDLAANTASCIAPPHYRGFLNSEEILFDIALSLPTPLRFDEVKQ